MASRTPFGNCRHSPATLRIGILMMVVGFMPFWIFNEKWLGGRRGREKIIAERVLDPIHMRGPVTGEKDRSVKIVTPAPIEYVLPQPIVQYLSKNAAKRFQKSRFESLCQVERLKQIYSTARSTNNITRLRPVMYRCDASDCNNGLGDQFRGMSSAFWESITFGYDFVTRWEWPVPLIPHFARPLDEDRWRQLEQAFANRNETETLRIEYEDRHAGTLCKWLRFKTIDMKSFRNYIPTGPEDCDTNDPPMRDIVKQFSWSKSGIGCFWWHTFGIGSQLESALLRALEQFHEWKVRNQRTGNSVIALHIRGGDRHMGGINGFAGWRSPYMEAFEKLNTTLVECLVKCAQKNEKKRHWNATYFVLSDNQEAKREVEALLPGRVYASPSVALHAGLMNPSAAGVPKQYEGVWVDMLMAALADYIVVSPSTNPSFHFSSFSLSASEIGLFPRSSTIDGWMCVRQALLDKGVWARGVSKFLGNENYTLHDTREEPPKNDEEHEEEEGEDQDHEEG